KESGYPDMKVIDAAGRVTYLESKVVSKNWKNGLRSFLGSNCLGIISPIANASFASKQPIKGSIAMVSQSGAMMTAILD
ncbi:MAG: hypothetical protein PHY59_03855, partial [Methanobacterium sp.]|nr:hypothetical protein [Methanobacterium sp.]